MPFLKKQQFFHKKEIYELINSIFWKQEPVCKALIMEAEDRQPHCGRDCSL
jgi:hypothetical protein